MNKVIETLLPWINPELWSEHQKQKDKGRENVAYEDQVRAMLQGTFSTDPTSGITLDEFDVSDVAKERTSEQQPKQQSAQGGIASQLFDQFKGSIRDHLFPGQGPTFSGSAEDLPPEYRDFYENIPNPEDFPPEKPPEDDS